MKPFYDVGQFRSLSSPQSTSPGFIPRKIGYGVEIRNGRDLIKRQNSIFISSGRWAEMSNDGLIDQQISPAVIGELIDPLDISPYADQDERKSSEQVLESSEIISGETIDFFPGTEKDGRITIFNVSPRGYIAREEIPYSLKGVKIFNETILGYSAGVSFNPFLDGGESNLGVAREGFYGSPKTETMTFVDSILTDGLGFALDNGDFNDEYQTGAFGTSLYSSEFGTDSIAYAGLKK